MCPGLSLPSENCCTTFCAWVVSLYMPKPLDRSYGPSWAALRGFCRGCPAGTAANAGFCPAEPKSAAVGLSCYFATFRAGLLQLYAVMGGVVGSARSLFGGRCLAVRSHWFPTRWLASCLAPLVGRGARLLGVGLFPLPLHQAGRGKAL